MKRETLFSRSSISQDNKQLQALYTVAAAAGKSLQLGEVLEAALESVLAVTGMEAGGILIVNDEKQELVPMINKNFPEALVRDLTNRKFGEGLCGHIAQSGKPLISPCIDGDSRVHSEAAKREKYQSYAGFPLVAKSKVVGVIELVDHEYRSFDTEDVELLTSIGHAVGVAIENAKLYERTNSQSEHLSRALSLLEHSSSLLNAFASSFSSLTGAIIKGGVTLLKTPAVLLALSEPEGDKIFWYPRGDCMIQPDTISLLEDLLMRSRNAENTLLIDTTSCAFPEGLLAKGFQSLIVVPLYPEKRGGYGGLFGLGWDRLSFKHDDLLLLRTFANQATVALENWWLYKREATMVNELKSLNRLIEKQNKALEQLVSIHNQLTELVLEESGFKAMALSLANLLGSTVVVQDRFWNIMACSCCPGEHETSANDYPLNEAKVNLIEGSGELGKDTFLTGKRIFFLPPLPSCGLVEPLAVVPIASGAKVIGYITARKKDGEFKKTESMALEQAATALALEFMKQRITFETEFRLKGDFIDDLLACTYGEEELRERARHLGYELSTLKRVLLLSSSTQQANEHNQKDVSLSSGVVIRKLRSKVEEYFPSSLVAVKGERVHVFLSITEKLQPLKLRDKITELANALIKMANSYLAGEELNVGVGKKADGTRELRESYDEALQCLQVGKIFNASGKIFFHDDLGLISLLMPLKEKNKLISFANRYIEPLLVYDQEHDMSLLPTLHSFLKHNCSYQDTVADLYIHANTLRYRLKRIQELTVVDLNKIEDRVNMYLALQIVQLLKATNPNLTWREFCQSMEI